MKILSNMLLPLFITSPFFFIIIFPIICFLEALVIAWYLNLTAGNIALNTAIGINAISSIISILFVIIAEEIYYAIGRVSDFDTIDFLNNYKFYSLVCLYLLTVFVEWKIIISLLNKKKISNRRLLICTLLANIVSYSFAIPLFYNFFV